MGKAAQCSSARRGRQHVSSGKRQRQLGSGGGGGRGGTCISPAAVFPSAPTGSHGTALGRRRAGGAPVSEHGVNRLRGAPARGGPAPLTLGLHPMTHEQRREQQRRCPAEHSQARTGSRWPPAFSRSRGGTATAIGVASRRGRPRWRRPLCRRRPAGGRAAARVAAHKDMTQPCSHHPQSKHHAGPGVRNRGCWPAAARLPLRPLGTQVLVPRCGVRVLQLFSEISSDLGMPWACCQWAETVPCSRGGRLPCAGQRRRHSTMQAWWRNTRWGV